MGQRGASEASVANKWSAERAQRAERLGIGLVCFSFFTIDYDELANNSFLVPFQPIRSPIGSDWVNSQTLRPLLFNGLLLGLDSECHGSDCLCQIRTINNCARFTFKTNV